MTGTRSYGDQKLPDVFISFLPGGDRRRSLPLVDERLRQSRSARPCRDRSKQLQCEAVVVGSANGWPHQVQARNLHVVLIDQAFFDIERDRRDLWACDRRATWKVAEIFHHPGFRLSDLNIS